MNSKTHNGLLKLVALFTNLTCNVKSNKVYKMCVRAELLVCAPLTGWVDAECLTSGFPLLILISTCIFALGLAVRVLVT